MMAVHDVSFHARATQAISAAADGRIILWSAETGRQESAWVAHPGGALACASLPDGEDTFSVGEDGVLRRWHGGSAGWEVEVGEGVQSCLVTPDGTRVVAALGGRALLFESASGRKLLEMEPQFGGIESWAISPDGRELALGATETTSRFDLTDGRLIEDAYTFGSTYCCRYSPDGKMIASACGKMNNQGIASGALSVDCLVRHSSLVQ
jgi:WD40 repeat protein